jgi:signal transduction histidine kinase
LGLAVCHEIVRSHGGNIDVSSEPGRGTRVDITLPARPEQA